MSNSVRTAAQTAALMAIFTLISKLLGFVREMVMANFFGTSHITDAYVMSITIPGIIFGGILSAVSVTYMPLFSKSIEEEGIDKSNEFTSGVLNVLAVLAVISGVLGLVFSDQIVSIFASGFTGEAASLTSFFLKISFFYLIFSATAEILEAFLRYKNVFIPQVAFGFIQNIVLIGTIIFSAYTSYYYLVIGYLIVYVLRLFIMGAIAKNHDFSYSLKTKVNSTIQEIMVLSLPVFIGSSMAQINIFVDKTLATGLPEGSVAALNYGYLLVTMISGITISIMTTIIYPKLAQASAQSDKVRSTGIIDTGITLILIIAIPCTLGAMVYSRQVVQIVYERGAFDSTATAMTGTAFFYYVIGMSFSSVFILLTQFCYSKQNMKTPMIFGGISVIINVILNLLLIKPMAHGGLALASSISAMISVCLFFLLLSRRYAEIKATTWHKKSVKIIGSAFIAVSISYMCYLAIIPPLKTIIIAQTVRLLIAVFIAGMIYLALLRLLKIEELNLLFDVIKRNKMQNEKR